MPLTLDEINTITLQVQTLDKAIATGALKVRFADREVTYRSLDEMTKIRRLLLEQIEEGGAQPPTRTRQVRFITHKGLY